MTTLAEHIIVAGAENRPPMLENQCTIHGQVVYVYSSKEKNGRMMLDSIDEAQQLQDECDVQATNIILHGLPLDVYALVNHQKAAKDIWDRVKLLMKDTELSYQERECRLYNLVDKMTMHQVQANTKFLNALPSEWSKFVTDVKLAKILYTTNYDQLYAYLSQYERHANEVRIMRERYPDPLALVANSQNLYNPSQSPQHSSSSMYPPPQQFTPVYAAPIHHQHHHSPQGEDPIDYINKAMAFLSTVASRFTPSNNQLRTSSNPRNQATIQDGRVTVQQVQERQTQSFAGTGNRGIATTSRGNYSAGQAKEKLMFVEAQEAGQILDEEQLAFIADLGIAKVQVAQQTIPQNSAFQTKDFGCPIERICDYISSAKAVLMANLSSCDSNVLSKVPYSDTYLNVMINQDVQEMPYYEQTHIYEFSNNEITSDSNIIPYSQYLQESQDADLNKREKLIDSQMDDLIRNRNAKFASFQQEIDTLKETLSNQVKEKESLSTTLTVFKTEFKEKESKYIYKEIVLENQNKELKNILCKLYDGGFIAKEHNVISVIDDEETLILEEDSRSKMLDKQNDPISIKYKIYFSN
ncbi:hypothetical protein Tco_0981158 [Tanacetum coccineum]